MTMILFEKHLYSINFKNCTFARSELNIYIFKYFLEVDVGLELAGSSLIWERPV